MKGKHIPRSELKVGMVVVCDNSHIHCLSRIPRRIIEVERNGWRVVSNPIGDSGIEIECTCSDLASLHQLFEAQDIRIKELEDEIGRRGMAAQSIKSPSASLIS